MVVIDLSLSHLVALSDLVLDHLVHLSGLFALVASSNESANAPLLLEAALALSEPVHSLGVDEVGVVEELHLGERDVAAADCAQLNWEASFDGALFANCVS